MKNLICVTALIVAGGQAFAEDGQLSGADLNAFGLSGMQIIGDAEGMEVRGSASWASVRGDSYSFLTSPVIWSIANTWTSNGFIAGAEGNLASTAEGFSESLSTATNVDTGLEVVQGIPHVGSFSSESWTRTATLGIGSTGGAFATAQ